MPCQTSLFQIPMPGSVSQRSGLRTRVVVALPEDLFRHTIFIRSYPAAISATSIHRWVSRSQDGYSRLNYVKFSVKKPCQSELKLLITTWANRCREHNPAGATSACRGAAARGPVTYISLAACAIPRFPTKVKISTLNNTSTSIASWLFLYFSSS